MNDYKLYVIIVTYNASKWIESCLDSISQQHRLENVIVVDNYSTDNTMELLKKYPAITVLPQKINLGFGQANNLGVKIAIQKGADFVFLLNQDTRLKPKAIENVMAVFEKDETIGVASPIHLNTRGDGMDYKFESYIATRSCPGFISDCLLQTLKPYYPVVFVNAAAWIIKVSVIKHIGLFAKEFFHYGEDSNFLQRLRYFNYKVVIVPSAFVHHDRDERVGQMTEIGKRREIEINSLNMLLNVNESLRAAYLRILRYAGLLMLQGQLRKSLSLMIKTGLSYRKYNSIRSNFLSSSYFKEQM